MTSPVLDIGSLVEFEDVAAGHQGVMTDPSGDLVIKPCTQPEIDFYQETVANHEEFAALLPTFMGTLQLGKNKQLEETIAVAQSQQGGNAIVLPVDPEDVDNTGKSELEAPRTRGKPLETELAVVLENITAGFKRPNILDVKLGKRLWADDAPDAKRQKLDKLASETTSGSLGFRVAGMKAWQSNRYHIYDKYYGRERTAENVHQAFQDLFDADPDHGDLNTFDEIVDGVVEAVEEIEMTVADQESRMYSSSLLLVYEGDRSARKEALETAFSKSKARDSATSLPKGFNAVDDEKVDADDDDDVEQVRDQKIFDIRVIDFAHAAWTPGLGPDENMLQGIRSVRDILKDMAKRAHQRRQ
ncbi:hypothetical protein MBLNU457_4998t1 [Dothideomycetes sp. NU457]